MTWYIVGIVIGSIVILSGLIFLIILTLKNRQFKQMLKRIGQKAEEQVNADIKVWAKHTNNIFIPAALYSYNENKVFEVDSILVTSRALIVIEIKSIKGGVRGDANSDQWQKVVGDAVYGIKNPIQQNDRHIDHIVNMTNIKVPTISLIVYSNRTAFLDVKNVPSHAVVIRHSQLFEILDKIEESLPEKMNDYDRKTVAGTIKSFRTNKKADINLHKNITEKGRA